MPATITLDDRKRLFKKNGVAKASDATETSDPATTTASVLVGLDWGTNKSCIKAALPGADENALNLIVPTVVGYANEGIVENVLPGNGEHVLR